MEVFNYPIDSDYILQNKRKLKKLLLQQEGMQHRRIAILSGSTIGDIKSILELFLLNSGIQPLFWVGDYNRYYEDIMFDNESLCEFAPELFYIHTSVRNWETDEKILDKLLGVGDRIKARYACPIIQNNFELPRYQYLDNRAQVMAINAKMNDYAKANKDFHVHDLHYLSAFYGLEKWFDEQQWYMYKYAMHVDAIPLLANSLANEVKRIWGKTQKCLVLDLDNTLWGGVVGETGSQGIEIGRDTATGEAYADFQKYVKQLHDVGVILAINSKNEMQIAKSAFKNTDMVLSLEDFQSFKANWETKADNALAIAKEINILPESMVFVDDNPAEQELIRQRLPDVKTLNIKTVTDFIKYIDRGEYFNVTDVSRDDMQRNAYYKADAQRSAAKEAFDDYKDYLLSLCMTSEIAPFKAIYIDRITQLINKTNQFNLTTKRYTISEVQKLMDDANYLTVYATLEDKFGSNGIVSAFIGEIIGSELHIRLWVMSCRVFKRDLEIAVFDYIVNACKKVSLETIVGYYISTGKNAFVANLYEQLGFDKINSELWRYENVKNYEPQNSVIKLGGVI